MERENAGRSQAARNLIVPLDSLVNILKAGGPRLRYQLMVRQVNEQTTPDSPDRVQRYW